MTIASVTETVPATEPASSSKRTWGLWVAIAVLAGVIALPHADGLPVAGQYTLGIFLFAVIVWLTEAIDYAVSALVIACLLTFLLGIAPDVNKPDHPLGTGAALTVAMDGFTNSGVVLIALALFIAEAMGVTGLDKRIALGILSKLGSGTRRILVGVLLAQVALSFVLPSTTARVGCLAPIILGIVAALGLEKKSRLSGMLMIAVTQSATISIMGVKTGAAANLITAGFMDKLLHVTITWLQWFVAAAPFSAIMTIALYFIVIKVMPPEVEHIPGGDEAIKKSARDLGPMSVPEKKLAAILAVLLGFWVTEGELHHFDTAATTIAAVALLFLPGIGILKWQPTQRRIAWGVIGLTAIGVSLGTALLKMKAAGWMTNYVVGGLGLQYASGHTIFAAISLFMIVIHLGFSSAPALVSTMIPVVIAVLQGVHGPGVDVAGLTLLLGFVASFGFVLPVSGPHHMIALGTGTFEVRDFTRVGLLLVVFGYALLLIFSMTYWSWLGYFQ